MEGERKRELCVGIVDLVFLLGGWWGREGFRRGLESAGFCGEIVAKLLGARDLSAPKACMCFGSRLRLERFGG